MIVCGFTNQPRVRLDSQEIPVAYPHSYEPDAGRLILRLQGTVRVELLSPALPKLQIKSSSTNSGVNLYWPAAASNFVLEYKTSVQPMDWVHFPGETLLSGDTWVANHISSEPAEFFRLHSQ